MDNEQLVRTVEAMKKYAVEKHVPIMEDDGIEHLTALLRDQHPQKVLEIGSAIGFSALKMAEALPDATIDTIERDQERLAKAVGFIQGSGFKERIRLYHGDALEFDLELLDRSYDAIFIDAAKGQYERFFEKYEVLLNKGGVIYCDNMHMHGMSAMHIKEIPRRKRTMIRNLSAFKETMINHEGYETKLLDIGDGIMICKKL